MNVTAPITSLGGVPGVHKDNPDARFFGFVFDEGSQLSEAPAMQAALVAAFVPLLRPAAYASQILQGDRRPSRGGLDDAPTQDVVVVPPSAKLFAGELAQMPLRALGAFALEGPLQLERSCFQVSPPPLAQELVVAGDGRTLDAEIHADHICGRLDLWRGHVHHNVQPEPPFAVDEVCGRSGVSQVFCGTGRRIEQDGEPARDRGHVDGGSLPAQPIGVVVVPGGAQLGLGLADLLAFVLQSNRRRQGFGRFDPGLNNQVRDKTGLRVFEASVSALVEFDAVFLPVLPARFADGVEAVRETNQSTEQGLFLFQRGAQQESNGSVHALNLTHIRRRISVSRLSYCAKRFVQLVSDAPIPLPAEAGSPLGDS